MSKLSTPLIGSGDVMVFQKYSYSSDYTLNRVNSVCRC